MMINITKTILKDARECVLRAYAKEVISFSEMADMLRTLDKKQEELTQYTAEDLSHE